MEDVYLSGNFNAEGEREPWLRSELIAPWWEIVLVLMVMLGPFAYSSTHFALKTNSPDFISKMLTDRGFLILIAKEGGLLAFFFFYLRRRNWNSSDFKIGMDWKGTLQAPLLLLTAGFANIFTALTLHVGIAWLAPHPDGLLAALMANSTHIPRHSIEIAWGLIIVGSIVNAYLEELVFMGYAFNQFAAKRGPLFALFSMVFLRMLLHTYKGPIDMLGIGAFSFVYGLAYQYLGRLWPLILAHACMDILAFSVLKLIFGR